MESFIRDLVGEHSNVRIVDDSLSSNVTEVAPPRFSFEDCDSALLPQQQRNDVETSSLSSNGNDSNSPSCCSTPRHIGCSRRSYGCDSPIIEGFRERQRLIRQSLSSSPGIVSPMRSPIKRENGGIMKQLPSNKAKSPSRTPRNEGDGAYSTLKAKLDGVRLF